MEPVPETKERCKAHVALFVTDMERSIAFYQNLFGCGPVKVRRGYAKFDVENPPLNLTLNRAPGVADDRAVPVAPRGGLSHLGIQVRSTTEVLAVRERWIRAGLVVRDEMRTECCYALQDKSWVRDPDGHEWEVFVILEDHLRERAAGGQACCASEGKAEARSDVRL